MVVSELVQKYTARVEQRKADGEYQQNGGHTRMTFAKIVFIGAGVWGILVVTPLYFLIDVSGREYAFPTTYPHFFYGFLSVTMAWQIAFLIIGSNPARFRPLMIPSIVEKVGYVVTVAVLHGRAVISAAEAMSAAPDMVLAVLFIAAFARTHAGPHHASGAAIGH